MGGRAGRAVMQYIVFGRLLTATRPNNYRLGTVDSDGRANALNAAKAEWPHMHIAHVVVDFKLPA